MNGQLSDQWQTPKELFDELNKEFNFDIDLCATKENSKCYYYGLDYLKDQMTSLDAISLYETWSLTAGAHKCAFMNPPYSNPKPFIEKAWEDSKHCKIVCLVKCDPSTQWWATFWNYVPTKCGTREVYYHKGLGVGKYSESIISVGPKPGCEVRFFPKRIQFDPPQQLIDSGSAKKIKNTWYVAKDAGGNIINPKTAGIGDTWSWEKLSGPTFPCALLIFDRRNIK